MQEAKKYIYNSAGYLPPMVKKWYNLEAVFQIVCVLDSLQYVLALEKYKYRSLSLFSDVRG